MLIPLPSKNSSYYHSATVHAAVKASSKFLLLHKLPLIFTVSFSKFMWLWKLVLFLWHISLTILKLFWTYKSTQYFCVYFYNTIWGFFFVQSFFFGGREHARYFKIFPVMCNTGSCIASIYIVQTSKAKILSKCFIFNNSKR